MNAGYRNTEKSSGFIVLSVGVHHDLVWVTGNDIKSHLHEDWVYQCILNPKPKVLNPQPMNRSSSLLHDLCIPGRPSSVGGLGARIWVPGSGCRV